VYNRFNSEVCAHEILSRLFVILLTCRLYLLHAMETECKNYEQLLQSKKANCLIN